MTYPEMTGTPKQIAWATDIRAERLGYMATALESSEGTIARAFGVDRAGLESIFQHMAAQSDARFWIDRRFYDARGFLVKAAGLHTGADKRAWRIASH